MIEVYAFSQLKKISGKACTEHEHSLHVFQTHNVCHADWIHPLRPDQYYRALTGYQFTAGSQEQFEAWREGLVRFAHSCDLGQFVQICAPNNYFYALLTCSSTETIFGTTICESLYQDFVKFWPKLVHLHQSDIEATEFFVRNYLQWQHACWLGSKKGCLEFA